MALRVIDLSFPLRDRMPTHPLNPKTAVIRHTYVRDTGFNMHQLLMCTHVGTHIDAPYHALDEGGTIDRVDLRKYIGPAAVVDFSRKMPREEITAEELEPYKGTVTSCRRMILRTGWDRHFSADDYFTDHPGLTRSACAWIIEQGVECLALDMPSTHCADDAETHRMLMRAPLEVALIEGLRGLVRLQGEVVVLIALPLSIEGGDGSPGRVVAIDGDIEQLAGLLASLSS